MKNKSPKIGLRTVKTVISVFLCFLIDSFRNDSVPFYAVIASILCTQPDIENSLIIAKSREISTIIGGILGMLFLTIERVLVTIYPELFRELILSLMLIPIIYLSLLLKQKNGTALMCVVFLCSVKRSNIHMILLCINSTYVYMDEFIFNMCIASC